jgi:dihydrofolate reductase
VCVILIAAMGRNRVIGSGSGMPWSVPEEYRQFLDFIDGQTVIMGRRSWSVFGPDLTSRHNIVVSRSATDLEGARVARDIPSAIRLGEQLGGTLFVAGGAQIYAQTLPLAGAMYLSYIKGEFEGDAYFPEFDRSEWEVTRREDHAEFEFVVYERRPPAP